MHTSPGYTKISPLLCQDLNHRFHIVPHRSVSVNFISKFLITNVNGKLNLHYIISCEYVLLRVVMNDRLVRMYTN